MDQQRFLQQLQIVLNPAQGNVKEATGVLQREFYKSPESLVLLIQIATGHEDPNLRQLAAVESRTLVVKHWVSVQANQKPQIREQLLRAAVGESSSLVRHSVARVISAIAKIDLNDGEWADLPNFLLQAASTGNKEERAVSIYILLTILETLGDGFEEKFDELFQLFSKTISDPESEEVRMNTLMALSKLAMYLDSEENVAPVKAFQNLIPSMVAVLKDVITREQDDGIMQGFEVFQTLLGCDPALLTVHLKDLVIFMNELAGNVEQEEDVRTQAISFLMQCVQYRKLKIQGMRIGEQLTRTALQVVTELGDASPADDDITPARSALGLLDILAQSLPPSQVVVPLLQTLGQYFNNGNADYRRAGIMALGMCVEGAPDFISTQMQEIFPMVLQLLADPEPKVRQASLHAVARLADDLAEDLSQEHERLMPLLFKNLASAMQEYKGEEDGPTVDIMKAGISAIDAVVDGLDEKDVAPYQGELVPILHNLFKHPDFRIKGLAAGALGSLASSAGDSFLPFFDDSMHLLQEFATVKDSEEELDLRASVTDAMGEMAAAAGPERYQPYVEPLMRATEEALHLGHSRLKESTYIFWGAMSKVYVEHFSPFLDGVVKGLFACIEQDETDLDVSLGAAAKDLIGQEVTIGGRKVRVADADDDDDEPTGEDGDIEDLDVDDEDGWDDITATTPLSLEKEIAVEVIGDLVTHTKSAYLPYFEKTIEMVLPLAEHPYEGVRKSTISTLHRSYAMLYCIAEESGQMAKWQPGLPLQVQPAKEVQKFGEILMTATVKMWTEEDDRATVADINRNMAENLRYCGPSLISNETTLHNVITMITDIITKKHPCQLEFGPEEETLEAGEETSEFDWVVVDTGLDVVSGMAAALGASFAELWKVFEKTVMRYAGSTEALERATAVGVIAEYINGMGSAVTPYTASFLKLLVHRLGDEDTQTRSNAAYAVGRLVEHSEAKDQIVKEFPTILSRLEQCLHMNVSRLQDNATGCLSRMILRHRENVPIKDVLPVLLTILPLKNDYEENDPLYHMICQLYKWEDPTVRELTPQLVPIFQAVLSDEDQLEDERRAELIELVKWLNQMQPGAAPWADQL
ncbi:importin beta-4 subunit [Aspergillus niger]|uniref:putative importin beta-4 subunit n=1 Tax=Aspergillus lacticoffeatus (strain CBS 101883) TaxID=1450533 RepID=UPI000D7FD8C4|nr:ARM repeat-containing protein [Aspergillus niger CBS 101883]PYH57017.1 ARM repeat-containing protein [Aspergillus niger CBS 101883]GJP96018.1 importin beta-4 subunit [Aspergillus niger]